MNDLYQSVSDSTVVAQPVSHPPIGKLLVNEGVIGQSDLRHALKLQKHIDAPLGDIMISEGLVEKKDVLSALAAQARAQGADLELDPPNPEMASALPMEICMRFGVVPWRADAHTLYVATSSPADFSAVCVALGDYTGQLFPVIVDEAQIREHQSRLYGPQLAEQAVTKVAIEESCRNWDRFGRQRLLWASLAVGLLALALLLTPYWTVTAISSWAVLTLVLTSMLKAAALFVYFRPSRRNMAAVFTPFRMPRVSVLVPLLEEREIAGQLIARLGQLTYPKSLLEVVLVLEESDTLTRQTIKNTKLPDWISVVEVPQADGLTTKPRALNYALNFCKGSIIGVWDAEDWPEADQIEKVVSRFNAAPDDVVCLQGVLDYYNSRSTWISRCFTVEYAIWWRIVMPGISKLGLAVPLGGTTLFFKRDVLEQLGGWDAHNVTEDADLGIRLARHGYKTELLSTVTREEATCHAWPWVRQRSRWLKGFLITYLVHMRNPRSLMQDLGIWRFLGFQIVFLASFSQFAAAPVLWSFWLTMFGITHPVTLTLGTPIVWGFAGLFIMTELLALVMGFVAISRQEHRHLAPVVPTMMLYFGLGATAAFKALWEIINVPFYWDKTQHGVSARIDPLPKMRQPK